MDPRNPGAVDEIINLGDFWDADKIQKNKDAILKDNFVISGLFNRAYRYIKAAAFIHEDTEAINQMAVAKGINNVIASKISGEIFLGTVISYSEGRTRKLFASAITPEGQINYYLDSILSHRKVYKIVTEQGMGADKILEKVRRNAIERGFFVEAFYCALNPLKLEHIIIPDINTAVTTSNDYHDTSIEPHMVIDMNKHMDQSILEKYADVLTYNKKKFNELMDAAIKSIAEAKSHHDHLETFYIPNMDFDAVERCFDVTMAKILKNII